jgi:hypothetical protein
VQNYLAAEAKRKATLGGPEEYGKSGAIFQGPDGQFYSAQFGARGNRRIEPLQADGQPLTPAKGVSIVGDEAIDNATARPVRNVAPQLAGKKVAEEVGQARGKFIAAYPKLELGLKSVERDNETVNAAIDRAVAIIDKHGRGAAGFGTLMSRIPESDALQLRAELDTIRANQGFDKLQNMRESSPTGGALGAVSEFENLLLQSTGGNLSQDQKLGSLRGNLLKIKGNRNGLLSDRRRAFELDKRRFGGPEIDSYRAAPAPDDPGAGLKSKYGLD